MEFIGDVSGSINFEVDSYLLSPAAINTFPWLSGLTDNYECFKMHDFEIVYIPNCSANTAGTVVLAVDYDSTDATPTLKQQLLSYAGAVSTPPWSSAGMKAIRGNLSIYNKYFLQSGNSRISDVGKLHVGSTGFTGTEAAGALWIKYDVSLYTAQIQDVGGILVQSGEGVASSTNYAWYLDATDFVQSPLAITFDEIASARASCLVAGDYWVSVSISLNSDTFAAQLPAPTAEGGGSIEGYGVSPSGTAFMCANFLAKDFPVGGNIVFSPATLTTGTGATDVTIEYIPVSRRAGNAGFPAP